MLLTYCSTEPHITLNVWLTFKAFETHHFLQASGFVICTFFGDVYAHVSKRVRVCRYMCMDGSQKTTLCVILPEGTP